MQTLRFVYCKLEHRKTCPSPYCFFSLHRPIPSSYRLLAMAALLFQAAGVHRMMLRLHGKPQSNGKYEEAHLAASLLSPWVYKHFPQRSLKLLLISILFFWWGGRRLLSWHSTELASNWQGKLVPVSATHAISMLDGRSKANTSTKTRKGEL